jgi:hypothetical protein
MKNIINPEIHAVRFNKLENRDPSKFSKIEKENLKNHAGAYLAFNKIDIIKKALKEPDFLRSLKESSNRVKGMPEVLNDIGKIQDQTETLQTVLEETKMVTMT